MTATWLANDMGPPAASGKGQRGQGKQGKRPPFSFCHLFHSSLALARLLSGTIGFHVLNPCREMAYWKSRTRTPGKSGSRLQQLSEDARALPVLQLGLSTAGPRRAGNRIHETLPYAAPCFCIDRRLPRGSGHEGTAAAAGISGQTSLSHRFPARATCLRVRYLDQLSEVDRLQTPARPAHRSRGPRQKLPYRHHPRGQCPQTAGQCQRPVGAIAAAPVCATGPGNRNGESPAW